MYVKSPPQIKKKKGFNLFCKQNKELKDLACGFFVLHLLIYRKYSQYMEAHKILI